MNGRRAGRVLPLYAAAILCVAAGTILGASAAFVKQSVQAASSMRYIASRVPGVIMNCVVHGSSDRTVSARIWFTDRDGRDIGTLERSWNGYELFIEFICVKVSGFTVVYPWRVYSDGPDVGRGTELFGYYERNGMPEIYNSVTLSQKQREGFVVNYRYARWLLSLPFRSSQVRVVTRRLRNLRAGTPYSVYTDAIGSVYLSAD